MAKVEIRNAYCEALKELGAINPKVVALDADVSSCTKSAMFGKEYPDRFFNVGIAELNMVAMGAGMAAAGLIPFVNTFAIFMALRGGDAIQSLGAYGKLNLKIGAAYAGYSSGPDGSSHHAITDLAEIRYMPNMTVLSVCDGIETRKAVFAAAAHEGPVYLRLSRAATEIIYDDNMNFQIGKANHLVDGKDVTLLATGCMVQKALAAAEVLKNQNISARVVDVHTIKPIDAEAIVTCARETGAVVTVEEHNKFGGFGSAVAEVLVQACPVPMEMVAIQDTFSQSGTYDGLLARYGLTVENIVEKAKIAISRK